ncbi:MAG: acyl carrier protein [Chloroflexi bacterium]|nr:acyl carrier protein [Chloroflexota bacterium]OQB01963.1 MAG: Acyl carrier protein [Chloroflexi bacterium ADurb.Bin222]HOC22451.1 acyl carrier protein [Anaerolineae bacterium]HOS79979.1 acyl carrier protein [Anaerolineae bacterium]HQE99310.1 acyl carrier protein [Anaerolineae bacterium]
MADELFERVKEIIVGRLSIDPARVVPEAKIREDLQADSLDLVELIMDLEDAFGISISEEDGRALTSVTVGEAVNYLKERLG